MLVKGPFSALRPKNKKYFQTSPRDPKDPGKQLGRPNGNVLKKFWGGERLGRKEIGEAVLLISAKKALFWGKVVLGGKRYTCHVSNEGRFQRPIWDIAPRSNNITPKYPSNDHRPIDGSPNIRGVVPRAASPRTPLAALVVVLMPMVET
jgi:hypothetical protein